MIDLILLNSNEITGDSVEGYWGAFWFAFPFVVTVSAIVIGLCNSYEIVVSKMHKYLLPLSDERVEILNKSFLYYKKLSDSDQQRFRNRVNHFLINKKIESDEFEVTEEMRVLIAATAMQILFGLESYYLSYFGDIKLVVKQRDNMLMTKKSPIYISWEDFHAGHAFLTDGYNPGLRQLAVIFKLEQCWNELSKKMFKSNRYIELNLLYKRQAERYISSGQSAYDDYSDVDRNEYFGVAVEYFFERPVHFYANQPEMYIALANLLRQDPLKMFKYKR